MLFWPGLIADGPEAEVQVLDVVRHSSRDRVELESWLRLRARRGVGRAGERREGEHGSGAAGAGASGGRGWGGLEPAGGSGDEGVGLVGLPLARARGERSVPAPAGEQLVVGAALDDPAVVEHDDLVGVADGREPVGDRDRRAALGEAVERLLDGALGLGVERARRLVEDSTGGLRSTVRAIAMRCFSPPEKRYPRSPTTVS